jgi:hypothetical protein
MANLHFSRIFIHVSHPLYDCKHNLLAAKDKEDGGLIDDLLNPTKVRVANYNQNKLKIENFFHMP